MDRITKSLLTEYIGENDLSSLSESKQFEYFSNYLVTSRHFTDSFPIEDICVGGGYDIGIDGISIIVNGSLVTEPEEISDLLEINGYLDVTFIFVQSESSSSFSTTKIGQFGFGLQDFFSETPSLLRNEEIENKIQITSSIYERSSKFRRGNPNCYLYYVTTGKWINDENLVVRRNAVENDLEELGIFRNVKFECIDAQYIQGLYRSSKNSVACEITFSERTVLPEISGIEQAYIGLLPAQEYLKLLQNDDEEIIYSLFYDNVRHWQEWNPVNKEIKETLLDSSKQAFFPLFNNGITIVAKSIKPTGNKFLLEDYQVVNGCQTSYVLYELREKVENTTRIPVRLISTEDPDIKNSIIKATNRQTQVSDEQLFALTDFPKKLEEFFPSFEPENQLFYERRSRQYNSVDGVEKVRTINMTILVRAFASMFLDLPHRTTRNYKSLLKSIGKEIFDNNHKLEIYYLSAYSHYRLEYLFRSQTISSELKSARYHILMAFRYLASKTDLPQHFNSNEMGRYCDDIIKLLWDENRYKNNFLDAEKIVRDAAEGNFHRDNIRTEPFTQKVLAKINAEQQY